MTAPAQGRAAVFGRPIGHSRSPVLHRAAYALLGLDIGYTAVEGGEEEAPRIAAMLRSEPGWRGGSFTMPLKHVMVPLMDTVSDRVARLGVLNTVVVSRDGTGQVRLHGENTDVAGIVRALRDAGTTRLSRAAVLGAGGTAAAATEALAQLGAASLDYVVRTPARAAGVLALAADLGLEARAVSAEEAGARLGEYGAVVSTLPPHAADGMVGALRVDTVPARTPLLDVAYDPWPSVLAAAWEAAGGRVVSGLSMLVHQAVEQVRLFSGAGDADWERVTNVMCDAVDLSRPAS
ncbi:shikimate 5-dehydrogenase [Zafaria cholistanensis]|uniref:Shikimate 5-dehydrogenase n=1 Tax=Zafaria cholistanensis TaxID=1682741 RepID=A0A5A7NQU9_9MICC|nr:shikimate dehydrogenase [Zafaria cholistanensis]GER22181.1 shikimate 5-dehydrogenase [Zafaria cholistanensis]